MKDDISTKYGGRDQTLSVNAARVSALVDAAADDMALVNKGEKVSLSDIARIQATAEGYLRDCSVAGVLPTVRGCAAKLGVSRQSLYDRANRHPNSEFSRWLEDFSDLCGELTMQAALEGTVAAVPAIFVAKSRYQWREAPAQIELGPINPLMDGYHGDADEIARAIAAKYEALPDD